LKNAGKKDLRWANQLKKLIEKLDKLIFPDAPAKVLIRKASKRNFTATYTHQSRCGGNYYTVFAKNLCSGIREGGNELIFEKRKNGSIKILPPEKFIVPPIRTILVALACHEVRHRMQLHGKIKFLMQNLPESRQSPLLLESLSYITFLFTATRKEAAEKGARAQFIARSITDFRELDAMVLEIMVIHIFKPGDPLSKVLPLLELGTEQKP